MTDALVLLVLVWAVLLLPGAVRSRRTSPHVTVGGFERAMDVLRTEARGAGGRELLVPRDASRIVDHAPVGPNSTRSHTMPTHTQPTNTRSTRTPEDPIVARRRTNFIRALIATAVTLVLAVVVGGWLWVPFTLVAVGTAGYVAILRHLKLQRDEAKRVVREIDLTHEEVGAGPRVAVGGGAEELPHGSVRLRRWDG